MKSYRLQPQACSQTYRSVLLENRGRRNSTSDNSNGSTSPSEEAGKESIRSSSTLPVPAPNSQPPTPTRLGGSVNFEFGEDRGDLIMFYNQIYVPEMKEFLLRFSMTVSRSKMMFDQLIMAVSFDRLRHHSSLLFLAWQLTHCPHIGGFLRNIHSLSHL